VFNDPARFKDDMVEGFLAAYARYVERVPGASGVMLRGGPRAGKVSLIIGGGSGHYPAFCGTVGPGLASGAVIGDIFTSPSAEQAYLVGKALDSGAGVLFSFGNYAGDVMNFGIAEERLRAEGVDARTVLVTDDIASASLAELERRRGIAGDFTVFKAAGAAAERGDSLDDVERVARKANDATRSFGVAFAGCTFPGADKPLFTVDPGAMEIGLGIHGEPGVRTSERVPAAELARILVSALLEERPADGVRAGVILNGLGATKYEELFVIWKDVQPLLANAGVEIVTPEVGELVTSLDMAGCSLTLFWLDDELEELWNAPADTPAFRRGDASLLDRGTGSAAASAVTAEAAEAASEASTESREGAGIVRACLRAMRATLEAAEVELGELDAVAGDGDHGRGMVRGIAAAVEAASDERLGAGGALRAAGAAWADAGGGSSGVLWGALLDTIGQVVGDQRRVSDRDVASGISRAAETVGRLGMSRVGDKCMLDALVPFAETLQGRVDAGDPLAVAWPVSADIATVAAERTRDLVPKVGRARPLADRSVGTPDPGAVSLARCLVAVGEVLKELDA
jgi:dihydroxyacetone kinase